MTEPKHDMRPVASHSGQAVGRGKWPTLEVPVTLADQHLIGEPRQQVLYLDVLGEGHEEVPEDRANIFRVDLVGCVAGRRRSQLPVLAREDVLREGPGLEDDPLDIPLLNLWLRDKAH
eukprot:CAMPEP_0168485626 /NCGR_PEP_ID=MMETSP0228-20121227/66705_1 /TAXON_ID=133427 /ORGANISM="Protoceratium reticulatum, Strain CCCM 535 (=CCMP 1889)" /LENGTH=117 /DNA_ID=CAMNT_0008502193 /DNA_START=19 /DNA_END=373 /DNA_ORIENTATION=-